MPQIYSTLPMVLMTSSEGTAYMHICVCMYAYICMSYILCLLPWAGVRVLHVYTMYDVLYHYSNVSGCSVKENLHYMMRSPEDFTEDSFEEVYTMYVYMYQGIVMYMYKVVFKLCLSSYALIPSPLVHRSFLPSLFSLLRPEQSHC